MNKKLKSFIAAATLAATMLTFAACGGGNGDTSGDEPSGGTEKQITTIDVTAPEKTQYTVGDVFSIEGGYITVTYSDGSTEKIALDAEDVTLNTPNMGSVGKKTITVRYGGKRDTFEIYVNMQQYNITLDMNCDMADSSVGVDMGYVLEADDIDDPVRTGYSFEGWYVDETCTVEYEFVDPVNEEFTLYARWLDTSKTAVNFDFDFNRTGIFTPVVELRYEQGANSVEYAGTPTRVGYDFDGWYTGTKSEDGVVTYGEEYTFGTPITSDTTVYAKWDKNFTGTKEFVFEAENVDLSGKTGPGYSSTASEEGMIVTKEGVGANDNKYLSYIFYDNGNFIDFELDSAEAATDVKLVARLSLEGNTYTFNPSNFKIFVNDVEVNYPSITINVTSEPGSISANTAQFQDYVLSTTISLKKGRNVIRFQTNNTDSPGGAMKAQGPLLDCIKVTSTEAVDWDCTEKRFPMNKN